MESHVPERDTGAVVRAGARGLVAAMAMTGVRTVTAAVGPHEQSPPEALVEEHLPVVQRLPERHREAVTELVHWVYGTAGGTMFGLLPDRVRSGGRAVGPLYGLALWLAFEVGFAPALGLRHVHERGFAWRAVVALDHILYGIVVAGRLAPEPPRGPRRPRPAVQRARDAVIALGRRRSPGRGRVLGPRP